MTLGDMKVGEFFMWNDTVFLVAGNQIPHNVKCLAFARAGGSIGLSILHQDEEVQRLSRNIKTALETPRAA